MSLAPAMSVFGASPAASSTPSGTVTLPPTAPPAMTYKTCCVAANGNWILGGTAGLAVTTDQGNTWTQTNSGGFQCFDLFASGNTILAVGIATAITEAFRSSTDGGATWSAVGTVTGITVAPPNTIRGLCCILGSTWWVAPGQFSSFQGQHIWKSTNSGSTWTNVTMPSSPINGYQTYPFCVRTDGNASLLFYGVWSQTGTGTHHSWSFDSGVTLHSGDFGSLTASFFSADEISGGSGGNFLTAGAAQGVIKGTNDSNVNTTGPQIASGTVHGVRVFAGVAAGFWAMATDWDSTFQHSIVWSKNSGITWLAPASTPFTSQGNDIAAVSASQLIAVGEGGPAAPLVIIAV